MTSRRGYTPKAIPQRAISSKAFREAARVPEFYLVSVTRCDPQGSIGDADGVSATLRAPAVSMEAELTFDRVLLAVARGHGLSVRAVGVGEETATESAKVDSGKADRVAEVVQLGPPRLIEGVYSGREIARRLRWNLRFRYLAGGLGPDFRTINRFRIHHREDFGVLFRETVRTARVSKAAASTCPLSAK